MDLKRVYTLLLSVSLLLLFFFQATFSDFSLEVRPDGDRILHPQSILTIEDQEELEGPGSISNSESVNKEISLSALDVLSSLPTYTLLPFTKFVIRLVKIDALTFQADISERLLFPLPRPPPLPSQHLRILSTIVLLV